MSFSPLIDQLIRALTCLPGVGTKSAQRMAFTLLERRRQEGQHLAKILAEALQNVQRCQMCRTLCEYPICGICSDNRRDHTQLCVVETPADMVAIEQAGGFRGVYFVLMGNLSPIDGIGPEELGATQFEQRLQQGQVQEVIMATSTTIEGETTAYYFAEISKKYAVEVTRIASGVPQGGELEYLDGGTLSCALKARSKILMD